jgi:5-formyltetrahydrofolate cyclo-ligase
MIRDEKQILRVQMQAALSDRAADHPAASARLRACLAESPAWAAARVVYGFYPLRGEPDWIPATPGRTLAFPRATPDGLEFFTGGTPVRGPHGAREPHDGEPAPAPDLILVPGLAFDRAGRRLGRGGGFYDRFLARWAGTPCRIVGVCFACQVVSTIPWEPHDATVQAIVTEDGWQAGR